MSGKQAANAQKLYKNDLLKVKRRKMSIEWATRFKEPFAETEQMIEGNCVMMMESKPSTIYWFSHGQKKETLNQMREIKFRETSVDTERIKCKTNKIKTGSSKNIDLPKVKRRRCWFQLSNKIQQHFCWSPLNHCYKCTRRKIIASKHKKQNHTSQNIGQYVYYNYLLTRLWRHKIWN